MAGSERLVDYFVVAAFDRTTPGARKKSGCGGGGGGRIVQRFPVHDWPDVKFIGGLEHFCQPNGWHLYPSNFEPKFFISGLTDELGRRFYCACLTFGEAVESMPSKSGDDDDDEGAGDYRAVMNNNTVVAKTNSLLRPVGTNPSCLPVPSDSGMWAPKCLALISRHNYPEVLRNVLCVIYTAHVDSSGSVAAGGDKVKIENLVGHLLGSVRVPAEGQSHTYFSLGATDKILLQPPVHESIPRTGQQVAQLFCQLGIKNVVQLLMAGLTEQKILFFSRSFSRLTDGCLALTALMYPLTYSHVFIPILPSSLVEVLSTPTPFIIGLHSYNRHDRNVEELLDVIFVDLDGGCIKIPDNFTVHTANEALLNNLYQELYLVFKPDLDAADLAFGPATAPASSPPPANDKYLAHKKSLFSLDKRLRAVMLRFFVTVLDGYRSCLTIVRIHPECNLTFHKAAFLGLHDPDDYSFLQKFLDSRDFDLFVRARGPPWRRCDAYDSLQASVKSMATSSAALSPGSEAEHQRNAQILAQVSELAMRLHENEDPSLSQSHLQYQHVPTPAAGTSVFSGSARARAGQRNLFPLLDDSLISVIINDAQARLVTSTASPQTARQSGSNIHSRNQIVPTSRVSFEPNLPRMSNSARRLQVLRRCIYLIFDNKIAEARKTFPAVLSALKTRQARLALCSELLKYKEEQGKANQVVLEHQQFEMITLLMNTALQDDSDIDECGIAYKLMPLGSVFCRRLSTDLAVPVQYLYTLIQDHAVWHNQQFWEASFYCDLQKGIEALYRATTTASPPTVGNEKRLSTEGVEKEFVFLNNNEKVLSIAAREMESWKGLDKTSRSQMCQAEEQVVMAHLFSYCSEHIINYLCPMEMDSKRRFDDSHFENHSNSVSNSMAESDSVDAESGFEECPPPGGGGKETKEQEVIKIVRKFADKICSVARLSEDRATALENMIKGAVPMHMEELELVAAQSSKLPAILKPKIVVPPLLPREELLTPTGLRCYLISDGRAASHQLQLLPAEGALFLTNYRIIFRGWPKTVYGSETAVTRFFPVSSLTKEKKFSINSYLMELEQHVKEGLQLRSNTAQLIKIAFDDDVHDQDVENFRKRLVEIRYPEHICQVFAFKSGAADITGAGMKARKKSSTKNKTIRGFANKTMKTVSRAAHFGDGMVSKAPGHLGLRLPTQMETIGEQQPSFNPNASTPGGSATSRFTLSHNSKNTIEQYKKTSYYRDWLRLGLITTNDHGSSRGHHGHQLVKATKINQLYQIVHSYPGLFLVPSSLGEEHLKRYGRFHKQSRVPAITWKHLTNSSLLLRGASFQGRGVIGSHLRRAHDGSTGQAVLPATIAHETAIEADLFFNSLIRTSQMLSSAAGMRGEYGDFMSGHSTLTPQTTKRIGAILQSTTQNLTLSRLTGLGTKMTRNLAGGSQQSLTSLSKDSSDRTSIMAEKASIYVFVQPQVRSLRIDPSHRVELIPIDVPDTRRLKNSFKKLMRACLPSTGSSSTTVGQNATSQADSFHKAVDESEWLQGLQTLLHINDAVIDLMDIEKSSVMICLEDGWDVTAQISSIAQLCMDPFYRTLKGFRVLVEKEWLAMGHKFQHRSNLTAAGQDAAFAPIFLQFLDIVHQIQAQFPMAFEFNGFYLRYLAYHHVSCRFNTFVFDNERLRAQDGLESVGSGGGGGGAASLDARMTGDVSDDDGTTIVSNTTTSSGCSEDSGGGTDVFDYIETAHSKSPIFFNFNYAPGQYNVIRPNSKIVDLDVWDYYYTEELNMGPVGYEFDLSHYEGAFAFDDITGQLAGGHCENALIASYDWIPGRDVPHAFDLLAQIAALEAQLGHVPKPWSYYWSQAHVLYQEQELPDEVFEDESLPLVSQSPKCQLPGATASAGLMGAVGGSGGVGGGAGAFQSHKPFTVEALMRGRNLAGPSGSSYGVPHKYERYSYTTLTTCDFCNGLLWGPKTGVRCVECNYNCHQKCRDSAPKTCSNYASQMASQMDETSSERPSRVSSSSAAPGMRSGSIVGAPASASAGADSGESGDDSPYTYPYEENSKIVYQGYLYKLANFKIKGWKLRWFVLDEGRHQIRYYDTSGDCRCKGTIELSDVIEVSECPPVPNAPKKASETCFFELKTSRRTFVFCADTKQSAQEWISKIQFQFQG